MIRVSINKDGGLFLHTSGLVEGGESKISGSVTPSDGLALCPDKALLQIHSSLKPKSVFFEVKVPFEVFPEGREGIFSPHGIPMAFMINWGKPGTEVRAVQLAFPRHAVWNDAGSFSKLTLR